MKKSFPILLTLLVLTIFGSMTFLLARKFNPSPSNLAAESEAQAVVEGFGKKLQAVSILAPSDQAAQAIRDNYAEYVSPALLAVWTADPGNAPGRATSSPWPDRIEISTMKMESATTFQVNGKVIEVTSNEVEHGGIAATRNITLTVEQVNGKWLITGLTEGDYNNP
ncbi:MAG TPA: hypothetical protein VMC09_01335 [Anaerolineales bacterium]|nr:hypothetical protein [Anaerolineales bacterium]